MADMPTLSSDDYDKLVQKRQEKKDKQAAKLGAHKEAVEKGEKKLVVERTPTGLYWLRWEGGGSLTPVLKGMFTSIDKLRKLAETKYGEGILR